MPANYYRFMRYLPGSWAYCADVVVALPRVFLHRVSVVVPCHHSGFAVGHDDGPYSAELDNRISFENVFPRGHDAFHQNGRRRIMINGC